MLRETIERATSAADRARAYFLSQFTPRVGFGDAASDLCCYYKAPMMFLAAGRDADADAVLSVIATKFLQEDGDFKSSSEVKSVKPEYSEFWVYTNGWILRAANLLQKRELLDAGLAYAGRYRQAETGGFLTHHLDTHDGVTDALTTSHFGLLYLESGQMDIARQAGNYLCEVMEKQPDVSEGLYLRMTPSRELLTEVDDGLKMFCFVNRKEAGQLYFMPGYPIAFLATLYKQTGEEQYLRGAQAYLDFALSCQEDIFASNFSHKFAWACSIMYTLTEDPRCLEAISRITQHFLGQQTEEGMWYLPDDVNTAFDQSAEVACWFEEIGKNLSAVLQKKTVEGRAHGGAAAMFPPGEEAEDPHVDDAAAPGPATQGMGGPAAGAV